MSDEYRCRICKLPLLTFDEIDDGYCEGCIEVMIERTRQRAEWRECHPGEPCPEVELTPHRKPRAVS